MEYSGGLWACPLFCHLCSQQIDWSIYSVVKIWPFGVNLKYEIVLCTLNTSDRHNKFGGFVKIFSHQIFLLYTFT